MKFTTQLAVVVCVGIVAFAALVFALAVYAHWSDGAIVGLIGVAGGAAGTLIAQLRNNAKLGEQDKTLDTIVAQTNGLSDRERQDIAQRAAATTIADLKNSGRL